ncbi:MAG: hypothetical protein RI967_1629 [Planctomycetota bacterium]|jgi:uncharacterized membrane protein YfcA
MEWTATQIVLTASIGLAGGMLGGMVGLGGSMVILPALTLASGSNQHLYQSAALFTNVLVAIGSVLKHRGRGTIRRELATAMCVASAGTAVVGVLVSNAVPALPLAALFGCFLLFASASMLRSALPKEVPTAGVHDRTRSSSASIVGALGGFASGLLGIGGGAVMVPLLQRWSGLTVREAVATSSLAMIPTAAIAAFAKIASIPELTTPDGQPLTRGSVLVLAVLLGPPAMLGASLGASLVYRLPVRVIKTLLAAMLMVAALRMLSLAL